MNDLIAYALVFAAIFLPIALWRREGSGDVVMPDAGWDRLPAVFRLLWKPSYLLENVVGAKFSRILPKVDRRYREMISASGLPLTPGRVFVCQALLTPTMTLLGALVFLYPGISEGLAIAVVVFCAVVGWNLPTIGLQNYAERRQTEITKSLPFAIDLIGAAMRSGLEFNAALRYYVGLGDGGALEEEFRRVLQDVTLGKPFTESLQDMADRMHIKSFTAFVGVVTYGTEIGASIAATLKIHGAEMRRERFGLAERKAARAPSLIIFPLAIFIMPAVFIIIFVPVIMQYMATRGM
jgi:tight adherence protein C